MDYAPKYTCPHCGGHDCDERECPECLCNDEDDSCLECHGSGRMLVCSECDGDEGE